MLTISLEVRGTSLKAAGIVQIYVLWRMFPDQERSETGYNQLLPWALLEKLKIKKGYCLVWIRLPAGLKGLDGARK